MENTWEITENTFTRTRGGKTKTVKLIAGHRYRALYFTGKILTFRYLNSPKNYIHDCTIADVENEITGSRTNYCVENMNDWLNLEEI